MCQRNLLICYFFFERDVHYYLKRFAIFFFDFISNFQQIMLLLTGCFVALPLLVVKSL